MFASPIATPALQLLQLTGARAAIAIRRQFAGRARIRVARLLTPLPA
jgi:hypothetical protein